MMPFLTLLIGLCIVGALAQLWLAARTLAASIRQRNQQARTFGVPTVAAPQKPQAVRKGGAE